MTYLAPGPGEAPASGYPFRGRPDDAASAPQPDTDVMPTSGGQPQNLMDAMQAGGKIDPREDVARTAPRDEETPDAVEPIATQLAPVEAPAPIQPERKRKLPKVALAVGAAVLAAVVAVGVGVGTRGTSADHNPRATATTAPGAAQGPNAASPAHSTEASPAAIQYGNLTPWEKKPGDETYTTLPEVNPINGQSYTTELPKFPDTLGVPENPIDTVRKFLAQYQRILMSNDEAVVDDIIDHMVRDPRADSVRQKLITDWQWMQTYRQKLISGGTSVPYLRPVFLPAAGESLEFGFAAGDVDAFGNSNIRLKSGTLKQKLFSESTVMAQPSGNPLRTFDIRPSTTQYPFTIAVGTNGLTNIIFPQIDTGK